MPRLHSTSLDCLKANELIRADGGVEEVTAVFADGLNLGVVLKLPPAPAEYATSEEALLWQRCKDVRCLSPFVMASMAWRTDSRTTIEYDFPSMLRIRLG